MGVVDEFDSLKEEFLRGYAYHFPTHAFSFGWREYAGIVPDHSLEKLNARAMFLKTMKKRLGTINDTALDNVRKIDKWVMENQIDSILFEQEELESYKYNPLTYTGPAFVFDYLLKQYAPLEQRVQELAIHLRQLPKYYGIAATNLNFNMLAKEHIRMAISMLKGMVAFFDSIKSEILSVVPDQGQVSESTLQMAVSAAKEAKMALVSFIEKLTEAEKIANGSFRMGKEKFQRMLWMEERVDLPVEKILEAGEENLRRNLDEFYSAAKQVDPSLEPKQILERIKANHPSEDTLIEDTQAMLEGLKDFLIQSEFVSVPSPILPKVIPTPKPFREWAFAAMDTPGALETKATDSYYYITPPDENWNEEEKEEWLKTFNYKQLLDISVHEAYPGHYLHHLHNQRSKSLMAKLFGAYHFWEGYALYVEEAMWEAGFQKGDYEYRMAQLIETLIRNVRLICAIKYHTTEDFTIGDATKLMMEKAFLEQKPAESEAFRGTFDPGYLNYALGKLMIEKLRKDYEAEKGDEFSLKRFHDELLSYGAPPIPLLRKIILAEKHDEIL